jgi:hypothetical protein
MRKSIACVFAMALAFSACSENMTGGGTFPFGPDNPLNVSGAWRYESVVVADDCGSLFCSECHDDRTRFCPPSDPLIPPDTPDPWYKCLRGSRNIVQEGENLLISDHVISTAMGVDMTGSVRVYSGDFLCGRRTVDDSDTTLLYTEDGTFHSNDRYESILTLSSSRNGTVVCKVVWSVTGRRAD